jgi:hypothetical protein
MNDQTLKKLDRLLDRLEGQARRPRRGFSPASLYLTVGLVVAYQLLVRFVPRTWAALLPGGLGQADTLGGWPGLVWRLGLLCRSHFEQVLVALAAVAIFALALGRGPRLIRLLVWVAAVAVIAFDAGIVIVTMKTSMDATLQGSGLF